MLTIEKIIKARSPQSVRDMNEDDEDVSFLDPDHLVFSVLIPSKHPTKQRIAYLWKRTRILMRTLSRLIKIWKDIQLYGLSQNHLETNFARRESEEIPTNFEVDKYLCHPESKFIKAWSFIILLLLIYTASVVPYRLCFIEETIMSWFILENIIDSLFFCDIIVTFNSSYHDEEMKLVCKRKDIALNYIKHWFFIDLTACIPVQLLISSGTDYNKLIRIARIPRLYRIFRFLKLLKFMRILRSIDFFNKLLELFKMTEGILRMIKFFMTVLLVIHVNGCIWYFIARIDDTNSETWLMRYNTVSMSDSDLYLMSIYFVMQTIATIGFGDIVPVTVFERIYALFLMIIGVGFYSYIVGNLSNIVKTLDNDFARIKSMLVGLNEFAKATKLPPQLKDKIKRYIETSSIPTVSSFSRESLIKELPTTLKKEVHIHMHKKIVGKILFFQDKDEQFIARFVAKMKNMELEAGECIYYFGDYAEEVYYICKGRVIMKSESGVVFKNYMQGSYFGELEVLNNISRKSTVQCVSPKATLMIITKRDFFVIMKDYPEVLSEIKATARFREQKIAEANSEIIKSIITSRELSKSKTCRDLENTGPKPMISRQGWKHFLKNSLGIGQSIDPPCELGDSVWDKYSNIRETQDLNKKYLSKNSLTELLERSSTTNFIPGPLPLIPLPIKTFARPYLKPRRDKNFRISDDFDTGKCSPMVSFAEYDDENIKKNKKENSIGDLLSDLRESEKIASERFLELTKELNEIYNQQLAIKAKLANFFVHNSSFNN